MRNSWIGILLLLNSWFCIGQNELFNNTYDVTGQVEAWTDLIIVNDTVYLTGAVINPSNNTAHRLLSYFNVNNLISMEHYQMGESNDLRLLPGLGKSLIYHQQAQRIYIPGTLELAPSNTKGYFMSTNLQGDSISTIHYGDSSYIHSGILSASKEELILAGASADQKGKLMKCDTSGTVLWEFTFGGNDTDHFYSLDQTHDGGYVMAGYTQSWGAGGRNVYVVKTDSLGNFQWQEYFGDVNNDVGWVKALENGDILVYGGISDPNSSKSKGFSRKLDSLGNTKWHQEYYYSLGFSDIIQAVTLTSDGYVFAGASVDVSDNTPLGWVLKTDFNGNELWSRRYRKRNSQNYLRDIIKLPNGDLMACGFVFPEGPLTQDAWLMRLNCLGFDSLPEANGSLTSLPNYQIQLENQSINWGNCIINWGDGTSNYLYEDYNTTIYHTYPNGDTYDIELIALACDDSDTMHFQITPTITSVDEQDELSDFNMYPNPTSDKVTVQYSGIASNAQIILYDLTGRSLKTMPINQADGSLTLSTGEYPNGVYLVVLSDSNGRHKTQKLVVNH